MVPVFWSIDRNMWVGFKFQNGEFTLHPNYYTLLLFENFWLSSPCIKIFNTYSFKDKIEHPMDFANDICSCAFCTVLTLQVSTARWLLLKLHATNAKLLITNVIDISKILPETILHANAYQAFWLLQPWMKQECYDSFKTGWQENS